MRIVIVLVAAVLAACGGSGSSPGGPGSSGPVQIAFSTTGVSPVSANVGSNGQVHFVNNDAAAHQIASTNCTELNSASMATGQGLTLTVGAGPKTCAFNDGLNPSATAFAGTINVAAPNTPGY